MNDTEATSIPEFPSAPGSATEAVEAVLGHAARIGASDIHIDPGSGPTQVRFQVDGILEAGGQLPARFHEEIIARLKILSGARTDVHAVPQDGRFSASLVESSYNIRVSFMPTYRGEYVVVRLLPAGHMARNSFADLGFTPHHASLISRALSATNGLILVTGPTGSGKTTTLGVCLGLKAAEPISVLTLEDPVEYEIPGVRHVHIRHGHGVTFASGLRAALRQDPDVIMVGEIRDAETARTAVHTALTGHLVLSTLHTTSALGAITRLADMGVERYLMAATLRLVIGQRLIRKICRICRSRGGECAACRGAGVHSSLVLAEVLEVDQELRGMIGKGEAVSDIERCARSRGFRTMAEDAEDKVDWGITTRGEMLRILYD